MVIRGFGSGDWLGCGSLGKEPCVTMIWSLQKLPSAVCQAKNSNRAFYIIFVKPLDALHVAPTLTSQHADTSSSGNLVVARRLHNSYTRRLPGPLEMYNGPALTGPHYWGVCKPDWCLSSSQVQYSTSLQTFRSEKLKKTNSPPPKFNTVMSAEKRHSVCSLCHWH